MTIPRVGQTMSGRCTHVQLLPATYIGACLFGRPGVELGALLCTGILRTSGPAWPPRARPGDSSNRRHRVHRVHSRATRRWRKDARSGGQFPTRDPMF